MEINVKTNERKNSFVNTGVKLPLYRKLARLKMRGMLATQRQLLAEVVRLRAENRRLASMIRDRLP